MSLTELWHRWDEKLKADYATSEANRLQRKAARKEQRAVERVQYEERLKSERKADEAKWARWQIEIQQEKEAKAKAALAAKADQVANPLQPSFEVAWGWTWRVFLAVALLGLLSAIVWAVVIFTVKN